MARAEPFPFSALPQLTRAEARAASIAAGGVPGISLRGLLEGLAHPLGAVPVVTPYPLETWPPGTVFSRPEASLIAVAVGDGVAGRSRHLALELDPTLAGHAVDRALGASAPEPRLAAGPATDGERGTLAYLAAKALAHAQTGGPTDYRVLGVITTVGSLSAALGAEPGVILGLPARVELAGVVGWARLFMLPSEVMASAPARPLDPDLVLELSIIAARATLSAADVAALGVGDVIIPDGWTARPDAQNGAGHWTGELVARSAAGGPTLTLTAGPSLLLSRLERGASVHESTSNEAAKGIGPMTTEQRNQALAAEVPVEVSIEIGRLALTVGELAALVPGAVVVTGIAVGQPLVLRVGTKVVGRGDLVVVDGELGVKLRDLG